MNTATPKQTDFIKSLIAERDEGGNPEVHALAELGREMWRNGDLTAHNASKIIITLLALPKAPASKEEGEEPEAGLYRVGAGVVRVYAGQKSGRMLAKAVIPVAHGYVYEYLGSAVLAFRGQPVQRLTAEEAGELGRATRFCALCGRRLDDPESVDRGVGPICAEKF